MVVTAPTTPPPEGTISMRVSGRDRADSCVLNRCSQDGRPSWTTSARTLALERLTHSLIFSAKPSLCLGGSWVISSMAVPAARAAT